MQWLEHKRPPPLFGLLCAIAHVVDQLRVAIGSPRSLGGRSASAATGGEKSHFAPIFPAVATATVLKSGRKLDSFPTRFATMPSTAQAPRHTALQAVFAQCRHGQPQRCE